MHTRYSSVYVNGNNPFREHYLLYTLIGEVFFFTVTVLVLLPCLPHGIIRWIHCQETTGS